MGQPRSLFLFIFLFFRHKFFTYQTVGFSGIQSRIIEHANHHLKPCSNLRNSLRKTPVSFLFIFLLFRHKFFTYQTVGFSGIQSRIIEHANHHLKPCSNLRNSRRKTQRYRKFSNSMMLFKEAKQNSQF